MDNDTYTSNEKTWLDLSSLEMCQMLCIFTFQWSPLVLNPSYTIMHFLGANKVFWVFSILHGTAWSVVWTLLCCACAQFFFFLLKQSMRFGFRFKTVEVQRVRTTLWYHYYSPHFISERECNYKLCLIHAISIKCGGARGLLREMRTDKVFNGGQADRWQPMICQGLLESSVINN